MNAITPIIRPDRAGLLTPSAAYKPFRYPWAFDMWKKQQQVHWMPEEVPLGEDVKDWASTLYYHERDLLTQIFRFFTQADIEVQDNYMERYGRVFKPTEVKMMLAAFGNMVPHLHWHIIPRYRWDTHFPEAVWAAVQRESDAERLAGLAQRLPALRAALAKLDEAG